VRRDGAAAGWTVRAYRFALDPSDAPVLGLRRTTGVARLADNHLLRRVSAVKAQRAAGAGYGVAGADLTPGPGWSLPDLRRAWNEIRRWVAPWWAACSQEAFTTGLADLCAALRNWPPAPAPARVAGWAGPAQEEARSPVGPVHQRSAASRTRKGWRGSAPPLSHHDVHNDSTRSRKSR
jgi:putative transposase